MDENERRAKLKKRMTHAEKTWLYNASEMAAKVSEMIETVLAEQEDLEEMPVDQEHYQLRVDMRWLLNLFFAEEKGQLPVARLSRDQITYLWEKYNFRKGESYDRAIQGSARVGEHMEPGGHEERQEARGKAAQGEEAGA